nr:MAG TPA: hypothetical protein [Caudoviricetes sp.]
MSLINSREGHRVGSGIREVRNIRILLLKRRLLDGRIEVIQICLYAMLAIHLPRTTSEGHIGRDDVCIIKIGDVVFRNLTLARRGNHVDLRRTNLIRNFDRKIIKFLRVFILRRQRTNRQTFTRQEISLILCQRNAEIAITLGIELAFLTREVLTERESYAFESVLLILCHF